MYDFNQYRYIDNMYIYILYNIYNIYIYTYTELCRSVGT